MKRLDAWYMGHLRRVLRIKHSYWSRIPHHTALTRAHNPTLPLQQTLQLPTTHPAFHVSLTSAYVDKVAAGKRRRGHPRQYWLRDSIRLAEKWIEKTGFPLDRIPGRPLQHTARNRPFDPLWLKRFFTKFDDWWRHINKAPTLNSQHILFPHRSTHLRRL